VRAGRAPLSRGVSGRIADNVLCPELRNVVG
jgi:hypothetical protein